MASEGGSSAQLLDRVFSNVDAESLACASIAQVHSAELTEGALVALQRREAWVCGSRVVIKVQHDDMQSLMESDIRSSLSNTRAPDHVLHYLASKHS